MSRLEQRPTGYLRPQAVAVAVSFSSQVKNTTHAEQLHIFKMWFGHRPNHIVYGTRGETNRLNMDQEVIVLAICRSPYE